jgi:aryl-alcohol dehydrogenase-like predicted oxidoreductase
MGLAYADIFYRHRPDPDTPLEEVLGALDRIVRSGKTLYVGVSASAFRPATSGLCSRPAERPGKNRTFTTLQMFHFPVADEISW